MSESLIGLACQINDLVAQAIRPGLARHGLTSASFALLSSVRASDGRESQADIGRRLALSRATVSEAVTQLEKSGLLTRKPSPNDARATLLALTATGHQKVNAVLTDMRRIEADIATRITERETQASIKVLRKIAQGIKSEIIDS